MSPTVQQTPTLAKVSCGIDPHPSLAPRRPRITTHQYQITLLVGLPSTCLLPLTGTVNTGKDVLTSVPVPAVASLVDERADEGNGLASDEIGGGTYVVVT